MLLLREICTADEINDRIWEQLRTLKDDSPDVEFSGVVRLAPDETGCNWQPAVHSRTGLPGAIGPKLQDFLNELRASANLPE